MIDEAFDTEFEARLRATLDEMIPKLVASEVAVGDHRYESTADELVMRRSTPPARGSRRLAVAALAIAATVLGLIAIARRDTGDQVPGDDSSATSAGPPAWYDLIRPSVPDRFPNLALTFATNVQLWFVAINPIDGKALEIQFAVGGYSADPTTTVDATGEWVESAQGWSVRTPGGLFVNVSCDIGIGGRDYVGTQNYCDFTDGITPFTKDEIRAVANSLATSLTVSIFDQNLGRPTGDTIDTGRANALILAAVPGQGISATDMGKGADHIYNVGVGFGDRSPSDTLPPLDAIPPRADTSVRILHGVYPPPPVSGEPAGALYDDAAVVSMFGSGGVLVRISTTDSSPKSVTRLGQLARNLISLDPAAAEAGTVAASPSTIQPNQPLTCGTDVPAHIEVPDAIGAMAIGSDVNTEYLTTQFVAHWTTPTGVIEMRWPPDQRQLYADGPSPNSQLFDTSISMQIPQDDTQPSAISAVEPGGSFRSTIEIANGDVPSTPGCGLLQFTVRRFSGEQVTFGWDLSGRPQFVTDIRPLITSSSTPATIPSEPIACGGDHTALGGPVTDPFAYPSSAEALQGFLQSPVAERLIKSGYSEMKAPDASVVYGRDLGQGFVTLITVRHGDPGWNVTDWKASSC